MVIMAGVLTRSDVILRPQLIIPSPAKSFYPPARVCYRRNTNSLSSSSGVDRRLVPSVPPPHHKFNNFNYYYHYYAPDSHLQLVEKEINKPFVVYNNHHDQSIINSSCDNSSSISVYIEIKKTVAKTLASLLLFGFMVFMTTSTFKSSAFASSSSSSSSTPHSDCKYQGNTTFRTPFANNTRRRRRRNSRVSSVSPTKVPNKNDNITKPTRDLYEEFWIQIIAKLLGVIFFIILAPLTIPLFVAIIAGYKYYLALCQDTKENSVLMLQVGVLDMTRELQGQIRNMTQIANTSNLDEVVKALLHHYDSCHFAYLSVTQCISDEKKYGNNFAEMMDSIEGDPDALIMVYYLFKYFAKSLANFIHSALIKAIKKINYNDKCSKQLFAEVLTRELAKHDKNEETLVSVDGMKCKEEAVDKAHGMVDNDYLLVTILVFASGVCSIPPLQCNREHIKKVLQKFSTIPKSKIESLQVLMTPQTEIEGATEQGLRRNFPLLKPLTSSGLEK